MAKKPDAGKSSPGISREQRISSEGLMRLEKQLQSGIHISTLVLNQWIKRYGDDARDIIKKYGRDSNILDN